MARILQDSAERVRFIKFAAVGTFGAVIDFGIFNLLSSLLKINPIIASIISFCTAVTSNFIWNRYWTYPESRSKPLTTQILQFSLVNFAGLLIRTPIFAILEPFLGSEFSTLHIQSFSGLSPDFLGHNLALAIAVGAVLLWNFFINRYWTYGDIDNP